MEPVYVDLPTAVERISSMHHQACHDLAAAVRRKDANTSAALTARVTVLRKALKPLTHRRTEVAGDRPMDSAVAAANSAAAKFTPLWFAGEAMDAADDVQEALTDV